ncbi:hypothetical protein HYW82_02615 [Candidatus Peregrinibacteria bacterium]|nr:hypothetical protein [Candidatus Peregrinibacteria bacterium]
MKRISFLLIVGVIVMILTGSYAGYQFWQKSKTAGDLQRVEKSLGDYKKALSEYEKKHIVEAVAAKRLVNDLKKNSVQWSAAIERIVETVPQKDDKPIADVLSYSGSANNEISLNVKTVPGSEEPYFDVADLIEAFSKSEYFADPFVPAISSGVDEKGYEILTFLMNVKYRGRIEQTAKSDESKAASITRN